VRSHYLFPLFFYHSFEKNRIKAKGSNLFKRNAAVAREKLRLSNYKCAIDKDHITLLCLSTDKNYVEAHHLIPMNKQDEFQYSINVEENIFALCPNCHRKIHYRSIEDISKMLIDLLDNKTIIVLKKRGIPVSLHKLLNYYFS